MTTLGDYTVLKQIGQGSLGEVLLAQHRFLKRNFALKVLPEDMSADKDFIQRFEREVGALAALDHPHIVKIHNVSAAEGRYFLVTDCVSDEKGEALNLSQYLGLMKERLSEEEIVKIVHQVASALDYAHEKLHGDQSFAHGGLKLNNILIKKKQGSFNVYLSDFGLTRVIGSSNLLTRTYKVISETVG